MRPDNYKIVRMYWLKHTSWSVYKDLYNIYILKMSRLKQISWSILEQNGYCGIWFTESSSTLSPLRTTKCLFLTHVMVTHVWTYRTKDSSVNKPIALSDTGVKYAGVKPQIDLSEPFWGKTWERFLNTKSTRGYSWKVLVILQNNKSIKQR